MDPEVARRLLADERAEAVRTLRGLDADFDAIVDASRDSNADDEHDPEGHTIGFERSMVSALAGGSRARLAEIDAALARLDDGSYGVCTSCGRSIPDARLEVRPYAATCVGCAAG